MVEISLVRLMVLANSKNTMNVEGFGVYWSSRICSVGVVDGGVVGGCFGL